MSLSARQVKYIIFRLRTAIDELDRNFAHVKDLILELARQLEEIKEIEQRHVCRKIKDLLKDKIEDGKITEKWIEESLPPEYKRKYIKSELSSLSRNDEKEKILVESAGGSLSKSSHLNNLNLDNSMPIQTPVTERDEISENEELNSVCTRSQKLEDRVRKTLPMISEMNLSVPEIRFKIPKEKYQEIMKAMKNNVNCFYLIFNAKTGLLLRSVSGEADK
jgi:hypothetical protein